VKKRKLPRIKRRAFKKLKETIKRNDD